MRRAAVAVVVSGLAFGANGGPATAGASRTQTISYGGYEITVPASWPVYRLDSDPSRCVRYDLRAVYLGTPGADEQCPPGLVGRTETVSIQTGTGQQPAVGGKMTRSLTALGAAVMANTEAHQFHLALSGVQVNATYGTQPGVVRTALATLRPAGGAKPGASPGHGSPPPAPAVRQPTAQQPKAQVPKAQVPKAQQSTAQGSQGQELQDQGFQPQDFQAQGFQDQAPQDPVPQDPVPQDPVSQAAGSQAAGSQAAGSQDPGSQYPGSQGPGSQGPGSQDPGSQDPGSQMPEFAPQQQSAMGGMTSQQGAYPAGAAGAAGAASPANQQTGQRKIAGFDTCTAPSAHAMQAWRKKYGALGIYIGGSNMACAQANLNASWVRTVTKARWTLLPLYVGPQAPCYGAGDMINQQQAASQGQQAASDAASAAQTYGLSSGSVIYYDMEAFDETNKGCMSSVLNFLGAWTQTLNDQGYISGVYASVDSGIKDLKSAMANDSFTEPQAIWFAQWDGHNNLNSSPSIGNSPWPANVRVKQYAGPHSQTIGGVSMNIDSDLVGGLPTQNSSG